MRPWLRPDRSSRSPRSPDPRNSSRSGCDPARTGRTHARRATSAPDPQSLVNRCTYLWLQRRIMNAGPSLPRGLKSDSGNPKTAETPPVRSSDSSRTLDPRGLRRRVHPDPVRVRTGSRPAPCDATPASFTTPSRRSASRSPEALALAEWESARSCPRFPVRHVRRPDGRRAGIFGDIRFVRPAPATRSDGSRELGMRVAQGGPAYSRRRPPDSTKCMVSGRAHILDQC
jgi:hypothetical protein